MATFAALRREGVLLAAGLAASMIGDSGGDMCETRRVGRRGSFGPGAAREGSG